MKDTIKIRHGVNTTKSYSTISVDGLQLCSGLTDQNGDDIYAGDVIQFKKGYHRISGEVFFENGSFVVREIHDAEAEPETLYYWLNNYECYLERF